MGAAPCGAPTSRSPEGNLRAPVTPLRQAIQACPVLLVSVLKSSPFMLARLSCSNAYPGPDNDGSMISQSKTIVRIVRSAGRFVIEIVIFLRFPVGPSAGGPMLTSNKKHWIDQNFKVSPGCKPDYNDYLEMMHRSPHVSVNGGLLLTFGSWSDLQPCPRDQAKLLPPILGRMQK